MCRVSVRTFLAMGDRFHFWKVTSACALRLHTKKAVYASELVHQTTRCTKVSDIVWIEPKTSAILWISWRSASMGLMVRKWRNKKKHFYEPKRWVRAMFEHSYVHGKALKIWYWKWYAERAAKCTVLVFLGCMHLPTSFPQGPIFSKRRCPNT